MLGPTLETPRLILRPPNAADFSAFAAMMADEVTHFIGGPMAPSTAWRAWASFAGGWSLQGFSMFSYIEKASGAWIGRGGPWSPEGWPGTEVGWAVTPAFQRKGYAREAASACIDWAFEHLNWSEVIHCIDPENIASIAVAKGLGSRLLRTSVKAPAPIDAVWDIYGQTREDWRARRA